MPASKRHKGQAAGQCTAMPKVSTTVASSPMRMAVVWTIGRRKRACDHNQGCNAHAMAPSQ